MATFRRIYYGLTRPVSKFFDPYTDDASDRYVVDGYTLVGYVEEEP